MNPWLLDALGLASSGSAVEATVFGLITLLGGVATALAWRLRASTSDLRTLGGIAAVFLALGLWGLGRVAAGHSVLGPDGLRIPTYGALIATGAALAIVLSWRAVERTPRGITGLELLDLYFWLIVGGIGGARLLYVLTVPSLFTSRCFDVGSTGRRDCLAAFRFWEGGLVFWGGVIGCVAVLWLWCRRHDRGFLATIDRIAPWGPLGHALGRVGCVGAGCCFGGVCDTSAGALHYPPGSPAWDQHRRGADEATLQWMDAHGHALPVWPVQLWEAAGELAIFAALVFWFRPRSRGDGWLLGWWMVLYSLLRFSLELYRGDATRGFLVEVSLPRVNALLGLHEGTVTLLSTSQALSLAGVVVGAALLVRVHRRSRLPLPEPGARRPVRRVRSSAS